jgi:hypothetical protein
MKRLLIAAVTVLVLLGASGAGAAAQQPASPTSSCVALITSFEATELAPAAVGQEVSGLASIPGLGYRVVSPLARAHVASIEACFTAE